MQTRKNRLHHAAFLIIAPIPSAIYFMVVSLGAWDHPSDVTYSLWEVTWMGLAFGYVLAVLTAWPTLLVLHKWKWRSLKAHIAGSVLAGVLFGTGVDIYFALTGLIGEAISERVSEILHSWVVCWWAVLPSVIVYWLLVKRREAGWRIG